MRSWLAFELNVLRRLEFSSAAIPLTHDGTLGSYLKRWDVRVSANDPLQSSWTTAVSRILNNGEKLTAEDVNTVLEDAYVPGYRLQNPALRNWFNETDAWWFDNIRKNVDKLQTPVVRSIASDIAMTVGDYVMSFTDDTLHLRQPLSNVFRRLWTVEGEPVNNGQNNVCQNKTAEEFIAESFVDMMFLRLPPPIRKIPERFWVAPPGVRNGSAAAAIFGTSLMRLLPAEWEARRKRNRNTCMCSKKRFASRHT